MIESPGQITVLYPDLFSLTAHESLRRFVERILQVEEVTSVSVHFGRGTARLQFDNRRTTHSQLLVKMARMLDQPRTAAASMRYALVELETERGRRKATRFRPIRDAQEVILDRTVEQVIERYWRSLREAAEVRVVVTGARRRIYVGLALASLGMMVVAFILPGIPTPPFLVATTYFGVQSSPRFYRWLCRTWLFGRMVRDWRDHRTFRAEDKLKSLFLTFALVVVGIVGLGVTGPLLAVVLTIAAVETIWLLAMPEVVVPGHGGRAIRLFAAT